MAQVMKRQYESKELSELFSFIQTSNKVMFATFCIQETQLNRKINTQRLEILMGNITDFGKVNNFKNKCEVKKDKSNLQVFVALVCRILDQRCSMLL